MGEKHLLTIGLCLALVSCGTVPRQPDLKRLYAITSSERFQNPVVVIHGVGGARIRTKRDKKEIWPGALTNFIFNRSQTFALEIDPETLQPVSGETEAYALFDGVSRGVYYAQIRRALEQAGQYSPGNPGERNGENERRYYLFVYDWRQDLVQTAAKLDRFIEQIRLDYNDPDLKVDIVAHSMGGLVTRYFLRYGGEDVLDSDTLRPNYVGTSKVRKAVLLGTPNWGFDQRSTNLYEGSQAGAGYVSF